MRIVFLCDKQIYDSKMSRVRFHGIDAIKRYPGVWLHKTGPGWKGFAGCKNVDRKYKPDLVVWYKPLGMPNYDKIKTPTCLRYNEMWSINWTKHEIKTSDSRLVICHHYNDIERFNGKLDPKYKLIHNPHCAEKDIFKDYGHQKTIDVLLVGAINTYYPLRMKFKKQILKMLRKKGYNATMHVHPGYKKGGYEAIKRQVKSYAESINRAWMAVTDASDYHYALAKYVEIPMCKTLLCADLPKENQEWYRKWMLYISKDYNAEKICSIIEPYLKDKKKLKERMERGYQMNMECRTQEDYARRFMKIAEDFLNGKTDSYDFQKDSVLYYNGGEGEYT